MTEASEVIFYGSMGGIRAVYLGPNAVSGQIDDACRERIPDRADANGFPRDKRLPCSTEIPGDSPALKPCRTDCRPRSPSTTLERGCDEDLPGSAGGPGRGPAEPRAPPGSQPHHSAVGLVVLAA